MPIFAVRNPPRVENTEARPPLKRWAYFGGFLNDTYEEKESDVRIGMERYESRFRNSLLPDTVTLRDGYELTIPEKWKAYQTM